ncbi:single-stranded-DNA-specific exonuclease RecJ [Pyruvatibacter sp.]|uniref:single-stranded-DNA-specific exonuclease RecJ n=1 Tax=Pyruvatibacter sp. TaxID=1981328 RepID=UPI0032EE3856
MQSSARPADESDTAAPLLGVAQSFAGRSWHLRHADERMVQAIVQAHGLDLFLARVLAARGVTEQTVPVYLSPTLRDLLPNPSTFTDMDKAAERLADAVIANEAVAVFGDYDVDGATSSALLERYLRALGAMPRIYIPDRIKEGYGPNAVAMRLLAEEGARVVITVDCGTMAHEALGVAREAGLDVLVIDHHKASPQLPPAWAVVNPNRLDCVSGQGQLAAVGVAFMLAVATNRALRQRSYFSDRRPEPNLTQWLDLVALGTVCDVVPLTGVNRAFVTQGLRVMQAQGNVGLRALGAVARMDGHPSPYHAGFLLGPRVNAGGRIGASGLGAKLLATDDADEATRIAERLDVLNAERRAIEADVLDHALGIVERDGLADRAVSVVAGDGWHPGVIGIVAARIKERTNKPAIVIGLDEKGMGKGSGRSVAGVDLGAGVVRALEAGLLVNGGGHAMAAGLTIAAGALDAFADYIERDLAAEVQSALTHSGLTLDGAVSCGGATAQLVDLIAQAGPYGSGNPEPRIAVADARVAFADVVGTGHVRVTLKGESGKNLKAVAFRSADRPLGQALLNAQDQRIHVAGRLKRDTWRGGEAVELHIEDAAPAA